MSKRILWCIPVPKVLDEAVEKSVGQGTHVSKSDLVRDAVRQLLNLEVEKKEMKQIRKILIAKVWDEVNDPELVTSFRILIEDNFPQGICTPTLKNDQNDGYNMF